MSAALSIGLVGVGPWGRHILRDLKAIGVTVHACTHTDASFERAQAGGAASIVRDIADMPACDGYVVAVRTSNHLDAVEPLLGRGKPIFVEKPLSNDLARLRRLPPAARQLVFTMHKWRYHPGIIAFAQIAQTQEFGPVIGLRTLRVGHENHHHDVPACWTLLPHDLSSILHITGALPRLKAVWHDPLTPGDGMILRCDAAGVDCVVEVSSGHALKERNFTMRCRDAVVQMNDADYEHIVIRRRDADGAMLEERRAIGSDMPLYRELAVFVAHLRGGPAPYTNLDEEEQLVALIDQAMTLAA